MESFSDGLLFFSVFLSPDPKFINTLMEKTMVRIRKTTVMAANTVNVLRARINRSFFLGLPTVYSLISFYKKYAIPGKHKMINPMRPGLNSLFAE